MAYNEAAAGQDVLLVDRDVECKGYRQEQGSFLADEQANITNVERVRDRC